MSRGFGLNKGTETSMNPLEDLAADPGHLHEWSARWIAGNLSY